MGLCATGGHDKLILGWQYTGGAATGTFSLTAPLLPGQYEFRYYLNDGYQKVKTSDPITVP